MSEYEYGRSKTENILIDQLTALRAIDSISGEPEDATNELYVSKAGDNSDGLSWSTAFTNLPQAVTAAPEDIGDLTKIIIGPGEYDIDMPEGGLSIWNKKVYFKGTSRKDVIITNTNEEADTIFDCWTPIMFENLTISPGAMHRGIELNEGANNSVVKHCDVIGRNAWVGGDGPSAAIQLHHVNFCYIEDVCVIGGMDRTIGFELYDGACYNKLYDLHICNCSRPFLIAGTGAEACLFNHIGHSKVFNNFWPMEIGSGCTGNTFHDLGIYETFLFIDKSTSNIIDGGLDNIFRQIDVTPEYRVVLPDDLVGAVAITSAVAGAYGAWVEICNPLTAFIPLFVNLMGPTNNGVHRIQIGRGDDIIIITEEVCSVAGGFFLEDAKITFMWEDAHVFPVGERMWIRVMNDQAGADSITAFLTMELI